MKYKKNRKELWLQVPQSRFHFFKHVCYHILYQNTAQYYARNMPDTLPRNSGTDLRNIIVQQ